MEQQFKSGSHVRLTKDQHPYGKGEVFQYVNPTIHEGYSTVLDGCGHRVSFMEDAALEQVHVVSVAEIRKMQQRRAEINALDLCKIVWQDEEGFYQHLSKEEQDEWKFTGLSNITFVETGCLRTISDTCDET